MEEILWMIEKLKEVSFKEGQAKYKRDLAFAKRLPSSRDDNNEYLKLQEWSDDLCNQLIKKVKELK